MRLRVRLRIAHSRMANIKFYGAAVWPPLFHALLHCADAAFGGAFFVFLRVLRGGGRHISKYFGKVK